MREVKRIYTTTTYTIMEYVEGKMKELDKLILEGNQNMLKVRKAAQKKYPDKNICVGEYETETAEYTLAAQDFIKYANKTKL